MSQTKESSKAPTCDSGAFLEARDAPLITLVVGETQLAVHKSVLVSRSPVFAAMLAHDTLEASSGRIVITDIEPEAVRQLVMFMYKDSAPQLCDMAPQLLVAADKYCVPELKAQCELQMVRDLTVENAVSSALLALRHSCPCLKETVGCFLHANLTKVMATDGWAEAVRSNPEEFVELSRLLAATRNTIQEEMNKKLLKAINTSNNNNSSSKVKEVQELLDNGANVGARDVSGRSVLHFSTDTTMDCLLAAGALVNARDKWHRTPIHSAIQRGNTAMLSRLVAASSNVNAADVYGDTLLHLAAQLGNGDVVKTLLEAGADKEAKNNLGETPLDVAERCKNNLLSTLSVSGSAKRLKIDDNSKTLAYDFGALLKARDEALITLVVGERQLMVHRSVLVAKSPVLAAMLDSNKTEASGDRIVITDVEPKVMQQVLLFMYKDSTPQLCSMAPQLLAAADKYCVPDLKTQCELQMIIDLTVENAVSSALLALRHSCPRLKETAMSFLEANLTKVMDTEGWAEAVRSNPEEFVELSRLLAATRSASQEQMDRNLLEAAASGSYTLNKLVAKGAYVGARDESGRTALHFAASKDTSTHLKFLLKAGADVKARDVNGRTALHYAAAAYDSRDNIEALLQAGARVDVRDTWLQTPLHAAMHMHMHRNRSEVVKQLLAASSDVNSADVYGNTPLHLAIQCCSTDVVKALLDAGADKNAKNYLRETPLDVATKCNKEELIALLR